MKLKECQAVFLDVRTFNNQTAEKFTVPGTDCTMWNLATPYFEGTTFMILTAKKKTEGCTRTSTNRSKSRVQLCQTCTHPVCFNQVDMEKFLTDKLSFLK